MRPIHATSRMLRRRYKRSALATNIRYVAATCPPTMRAVAESHRLAQLMLILPHASSSFPRCVAFRR